MFIIWIECLEPQTWEKVNCTGHAKSINSDFSGLEEDTPKKIGNCHSVRKYSRVQFNLLGYRQYNFWISQNKWNSIEFETSRYLWGQRFRSIFSFLASNVRFYRIRIASKRKRGIKPSRHSHRNSVTSQISCDLITQLWRWSEENLFHRSRLLVNVESHSKFAQSDREFTLNVQFSRFWNF